MSEKDLHLIFKGISCPSGYIWPRHLLMNHKHSREGVKAEFPDVSPFSKIWQNETLIPAKPKPDNCPKCIFV